MKYTVIKERLIPASSQQILNYLTDFNNWSSWSPWACLDPATIVNCQDSYLEWESKFTGVGNMKLISHIHNQVNIELNFLKPFKSQALVTFRLDEMSANETKVAWQMKSRLPLFLCFFKKIFQVMIGRDFERGLTRLEYMVKFGKIPSRLEYFDTPDTIAGFKVAGISSVSHMSGIADSMRTTFARLHELVNEANILPTGMVCFCDKFKISQEVMHYTAAAVYDGGNLFSNELNHRNISEHKAIKVTLYGSYEFLGDAWAGIYAHLRGLKLKVDKRVAPYEVYIKGPHNADNPEEYITEIYMPVK